MGPTWSGPSPLLAWILKVVNVHESQFSHGRTLSPLLFKFQTIGVDFDNRSIGEGVVEYVDERHAHSAIEPRGVVACPSQSRFSVTGEVRERTSFFPTHVIYNARAMASLPFVNVSTITSEKTESPFDLNGIR